MPEPYNLYGTGGIVKTGFGEKGRACAREKGVPLAFVVSIWPTNVRGPDPPDETFRVLKEKEERLYGDLRPAMREAAGRRWRRGRRWNR